MIKSLFYNILIISLAFCYYKCKTNNSYQPLTIKIDKEISFNDSLIDKTQWHYKDIIDDSIPGISLYKAYNTILKDVKGREVIVAVLDTKIDINHEAFKGQLWVNKNEIPHNDIDDDKNGFIDDVNGWNFLGNNKGESVLVENYEYVRIVRQYRNLFEKNDQIDTLSFDYKNYKRAKEAYEKKLISSKKDLKKIDVFMNSYFEAKDALKDYFPNYIYSYDILNSIDTTGNNLSKHVKTIKFILDYDDTDKNITRVYKSIKDSYEKKVNIDFYPRQLVGDDFNNINDSIYGNNLVADHLETINHGTRVTGMILNYEERKRFKTNIKVMPIVVLPEGGSTHNKDVALGIRYAVNNGAKIINLSFGSNFASHPEWLKDAFLYAEKNNVLIVSAGGNDGKNIDEDIHIYPNDRYNDEPEFSDNFLYVGASSYTIDSNLLTYSDYGKINIDIFAPGQKLYTTLPENEYHFDRGTSLSSSLTSKVAALIFSYYPNLTASQVKHIIMDSGVEYTFPVKTPIKEDKDKMTPFNELSKSGKIVNAYNALIMADSVSKANKRKRD